MDNLTNPGVILGTVDLAGILVTWVYLQKEVQKLNKQIQRCKEECSLKSECKETVDSVQKIMEEFERKLNNIVGAINANRAMINNLNDRLVAVEKSSALIVPKGDATPAATPVRTITLVTAAKENLLSKETESTKESTSFKEDISQVPPVVNSGINIALGKSADKSKVGSNTVNEKNTDSSDEDDDIDLVIKLAKDRKS